MKCRTNSGELVEILGRGSIREKKGNVGTMLVLVDGHDDVKEMFVEEFDQSILPTMPTFTVTRMVYFRPCCKPGSPARMEYYHELELVHFTFQAISGAEASVLADAAKYNRELDLKHHQRPAPRACWMPKGGN